MDYDNSSFEDISSSGGKKFIALVVSDQSDMDDSGIWDHQSLTSPSPVATPPTPEKKKKKQIKQRDSGAIKLRRPQHNHKHQERDATKRYSMMIPDPTQTTTATSISANPTKAKPAEEKKRWSFISNHSSSSKKRWSTLSSFTNDSGNTSTNIERHSIHSNSKKRFSTASNISVATTTTSTNNTEIISSFSNKTNNVDNVSIHTGKSITTTATSSSMKRSSTGSSLRQFLTNIVTPSDHNIHHDTSNKENQYSTIKDTKTKSKNNSINTVTPAHVDTRRPLQQIIINDSYVTTSNNNNNTNVNTTTHDLNRSMANLSIRSKRSSISSMSSSSSLSKWKFWKKNSNSYNNSTTHHLKTSTSSHSINISSFNDKIYQQQQQYSHHNSIPQSHSTRSLHNILNDRPLSTYSHETNKLRSKNSFSDFHKNFYHTTNGSIATSIHNNITDIKSEFSFYSNIDNNTNITSAANTNDYNKSTNMTNVASLKKKSSTSSLSISGLKHRTSQHSLKHKTSHSSLQKFKTRRKSTNNNNNDDGSSFLTINSSINSGHSSGNASSNPKISLPIPNQVSRDKIRTKLKNSTSLLSLNSHTPIDKKTYDETILNQLLQLCSVKYVIDYIDLDSNTHNHLETLSSNHSIQLSNHSWRTTSTLDPNQTIICKKFLLSNDKNDIILKELQLLTICHRTPGLPQLLQSYIISNNDNENVLYVFIKDHGNPITELVIKSWSQCLKIFWQCVNILYVAEAKFQFEHRNLTMNHILLDKNGTVTICDLAMSRAQYGEDTILFTRLDHPVFFQSGSDYLFETYHSMRSVFIQHGEQWSNFEPKTNLLWLRYLAMNLLIKNKGNKLMGPGREQLTKIVTLLDPHHGLLSNANSKRGSHLFNKKKDHEIKSAGDLLRYK